MPSGQRESMGWNLLWTWSRPRIDWGLLLIWQRVNHFPEVTLILTLVTLASSHQGSS